MHDTFMYVSYHSVCRELTSMANVNSRSRRVTSQIPSEAWRNLQHCEQQLSPKCWVSWWYLLVLHVEHKAGLLASWKCTLRSEHLQHNRSSSTAQSSSTSEHWNSVTPMPTTEWPTMVKPHEMSPSSSSSVGPVANATDVLQPGWLINLNLSTPLVWTFPRSLPGNSTTTRQILVPKGGTVWARIGR